MKILVTGGAGFIGTALVKRLVAEGEQVRVLDNCSRSDWFSLSDLKIETYPGDIRNLADLLDATRGVNEIIHLAYINGTKSFYDRPHDVLDVAVKGMVNLLEVCKTKKIRRFMLASSSEVCRAQVGEMNESTPLVIPDPFNPRYSYSAGKIISEMMAIHSKLFDWLVIFRPYNIYGPGMHTGHVVPDFAKQLQERMAYSTANTLPFTILGSVSETRSFCYIDDFIDGLMIVRKQGKHQGIYNIGTPEETTIGELAQRMAKVYGRRLSLIQANELREGSILRRKPDISRLVEMGYQPKVTLDDGLRRILLCQ